AVREHGSRGRGGLDLEICPLPRRSEVRARGRGAIAATDGVLTAPEAFLLLAVVVVGDWEARGRGGFEPCVVKRIARLCEFRADRPGSAAPRILARLPALAALEVGQHIGIGPTARALLRPTIVVAAMRARLGHHVDGGRSA